MTCLPHTSFLLLHRPAMVVEGICLHFEFILVSSVLSGGGPRVVVITAAFHARVRGSVPGLISKFVLIIHNHLM